VSAALNTRVDPESRNRFTTQSGLIMGRAAQVFPLRTPAVHGFHWKWRCVDGSNESATTFIYFFDCVEDARRAGYCVEAAIGAATTIEQRRPCVGR